MVPYPDAALGFEGPSQIQLIKYPLPPYFLLTYLF